MPRYDDRYGGTRLYVGRISSRTRSRDLEDLFSRYGRVRDVDMKRDYAFVEFSDPRDADDAVSSLNGRELDGSRIIVEFSRGGPRGPGGSRGYGSRGPVPGSGRCFNCGLDGHWARDCKAGDWKNKCYRCGERGHVERNCHNSPKKLRRGRSYSRSPSPRRRRSRSPGFSRSRSYSRSRSPPRRGRAVEHVDRSRSPHRSRSPRRRKASPPMSRDRSLTPDDISPRGRSSLSPRDDDRNANGSDYGGSPRPKSRSPADEVDRESPREQDDRSPIEANGSPSAIPRNERSEREDDEDDYRASPRGSE